MHFWRTIQSSHVQDLRSISGGQRAPKPAVFEHQDSPVEGFDGASPGGHPDKEGPGAPQGYVSGGAGDAQSETVEDRARQWEIFRGGRPSKQEAEGTSSGD